MCGQCGAEVLGQTSPPAETAPEPEAAASASTQSATAAEQVIAGWQVLREMGTAGTARQRFAVRRSSDGLDGVMTIYGPGAQPDAAVYDAVRQRLSTEHIAALIDHGQMDDRAYDVTEAVGGGSLAELQVDPADRATLQQIVEELSTALAAFAEVGLRHRALHPEKVLLRSRAPLDLILTGFESSRLSEADLEIESLLDVSRYTAPEAVMGAVATASDWWGLGMMLLGLVTGDRCFEGANDQLFLIYVQANGAPIPPGLDPRLDLLLRGLLTVDRTTRWQWREVREWLAGGAPPAPQRQERGDRTGDGPSIRLGGASHHDPRRFAIEAARAAHWSEACDLLAHGRIGLWAEEVSLDSRVVAGLRQLGRRVEPAVGFRLGIALQLLNPQLPLIYEEEIVNPDWLLRNPTLGYELISSSVPELLPQLGVESDDWLRRLAKRAASVRERAAAAEIALDEARWEVLVLSASHPRLMAEWDARRREFPEAHHPVLASLMERREHHDEDLIVLLSASLDQFRPRDELIFETLESGQQHGLTDLSREFVGEWLTRPRREVFAAIEQRIAGFARCGHPRLDAWADRFRLERRLPLSEAILLLGHPADHWQKPKHQEYVASVLGFFEKRISAASRRGPLVRMAIGKTTPRIDLLELADDARTATALLSSLLEQSNRTFPLDPMVFADENGPEARMRSLLNKTTQYRRDTGINGGYIGFPFLSLPAGGETKSRLAPILLWPVNLAGEIGSRGRFSLAFDTERGGVRLNPAFEGLYGVEGAGRWRALVDDLLSRGSFTPGDVLDAFGAMASPSGRTLVRLPRKDAVEPAAEDRIVCCAVLFHLQFLGQSLIEDLRQLKQRPLDGTALETVLRVDGDAGTASPGPESITEVPAGDEPILVTHSDPSQEEAIAKVSQGRGLVVQGPPGTGKSQTIVNLVADSIARSRSVLIVCQKMPALEVVRKRLVAEQLGGRIVMVTNVTADRTSLLTDFRTQLESAASADPRAAHRRERDTAETRNRLRQLESEIDSQHEANHIVDPTSRRSYRQILGELIHLEERAARPLPDVIGLRHLFRDLAFEDLRSCEAVCGALMEEWMAAAYEGSPLEATLPQLHDAATAAEFERILRRFSAAEAERQAIPSSNDGEKVLECPAELDGWLTRSRPLLERWDDRQLGDCAPFLPLFRQRSGADYRHILERLSELEHGRSRPAIIPRDLSEWLGHFLPLRVEEIAESCERNAESWWAARFEGSPLEGVSLALRPDECKTFRAAFENFVAAESRRVLAFAAAPDAAGVREPEQLQAWLATHEESLLESASAAGIAFTRLLTLPNARDLCVRYETVLRHGVALRRSPPSVTVTLAPLAELLARCDEARIDRIANECALTVDVWLRAHIDARLLEAVAVFPRDQAACVRLQTAVSEYVAAELARDAEWVRRPAARLVKPTVSHHWLTEYAEVIENADEALFAEAARWQLLFLPQPGGPSKAEGLRQRLFDLLQELTSLSVRGPINHALELKLVPLDALQMDELNASVKQVSGPPVRWFQWKRSAVRRWLQSWLRERGIVWHDDLPRHLEEAIGRETERRRIRHEVEQVLRVLAIAVDFNDWDSYEQRIAQIPERLTGAFLVCKAVMTYPVAANKRKAFNGWGRGPLMEHLRAQRDALDLLAAQHASQAALEPLRAIMSPAWLEWQEHLVVAGPLPSASRRYLERLPSEVERLADVAAIRTQLTGCDELTRRVLGALTPIRAALASLPPGELSQEVERQIRTHGAIGRQQVLFSEAPVLRPFHREQEEDVPTLCKQLDRVRSMALALESCPDAASLRTELAGKPPEAARSQIRRLKEGAELALARRGSLAALSALRDFFDSAWLADCEQAIEANRPNHSRLEPLRAALPGLADYMAFRTVSAELIPVALQAFRLLAAARTALEEVPPCDRPSEVGRTIRQAYWTRKQALAEQSTPVLRRLGATAVDRYAPAMERLEQARRLGQIVDSCPYPRPLSTALESGRTHEVHRVLEEFSLRLQRKTAAERSLESLTELAEWMTPAWVQESRRRVNSWESNAARLDALLAAMPTFGAYQLFRARAGELSRLQRQVFSALERIRPTLDEVQGAGGEELTAFVRRLLHREALLAWKGEFERRDPALVVNRRVLDGKLKELGDLDRQMRGLNRDRIGADLPDRSVASAENWEDITRLRGPRARSLRQFFELGRGRGLLAFRPVWLMTPDVASQLLPLEKAIFDLVIFDEASQMPVEYAIPCLYRARTVLISGDEKQMPPSTFFSGRLESDESEWTDEELLDESATQQERSQQEEAWNRREVKDCPDLLHLGSAALPRATLQIHYRSAFRELIAFSNAAFYRNDLSVPVRHPDETVQKERPVEYIEVNGVYGDQRNPDEARKVVDVLAGLWSPSAAVVPSVGVVTFNLRQADLIEELLEERAESDEAFRAAYRRELERSDGGEDMSFFVKNVENVQGDERDMIIFSTTFGRTKAGAFRRGFGALGQAGGERRLNVAVTRARRKVIIAGSMPIAEISDMLRTRRRPDVPRDYLQAYLHYAALVSAGQLDESRRLIERISGEVPRSEIADAELDGFKASVAGFIRKLGYDPVPTGNDPVLGVDFSIRDPLTGLFGVGIECDPPQHRLTRHARAREIWRHSLLSRSYASLCQVSAYAWYHDPEGERRRLKESLNNAMSWT